MASVEINPAEVIRSMYIALIGGENGSLPVDLPALTTRIVSEHGHGLYSDATAEHKAAVTESVLTSLREAAGSLDTEEAACAAMARVVPELRQMRFGPLEEPRYRTVPVEIDDDGGA